MKKILTRNAVYGTVKQITPPFIFNLFKKTGIYTVVKKTAHKFISSGMKPSWVEVKHGDLKGRHMFLDQSGKWQSEIVSGDYDSFMFDYLKSHGVKDKVIFDIGSHIGFSAIYFAQLVGNKGKIYAFEPNPSNVDRFKETLTKNQDLEKIIKINAVAVSNKTGSEEFSFSADIESGLSSGGFLRSADTHMEKNVYENEIGFIRTKVPTVSLDNIESLGIKDKPDIIKIDVEGAEYLVLEGATKLLKDNNPLLLIEIHSIFNMFKAMEILTRLGYKINLLKEESDGRCFIAGKK